MIVSLVPLIDQIYHDLHHHVFFLSLALGNHQGKGNKGAICQTL